MLATSPLTTSELPRLVRSDRRSYRRLSNQKRGGDTTGRQIDRPEFDELLLYEVLTMR